MRGYFGIGIWHVKSGCNIGTLWRAAYLYNAAFIFTIGRRYKAQSSDTPKTPRNIPLYHYDTIGDLFSNLPHSCQLVGVEQGGAPLSSFTHPARTIYLLGAEDHGLNDDMIASCHHTVEIETHESASMNVSAAGSIIMYDRFIKSMKGTT